MRENSGVIRILTDAEMAGERLDLVLAAALDGVSRSAVQKLMAAGAVTADGQPVLDKKTKAKAGQELLVTLPEPKEALPQPEDIPLDILYEDESVLVIDKPRGLVVHPGPGNESGTLVNGLLYHCGEGIREACEQPDRPGIVHRIDKDTSGLLVAVKTRAAWENLKEQFSRHSAGRVYTALTYNNFAEDEGRIDAPIGRDPANRLKRAVSDLEDARPAVTNYRVIERMGNYTLVEARLETGRTHQIRVHLASIGHPLVGDPLYGPKKDRLNAGGQILHAGQLSFDHPVTGERMHFESPLPDYFLAALRKARAGK